MGGSQSVLEGVARAVTYGLNVLRLSVSDIKIRAAGGGGGTQTNLETNK